MSEIVLTAAPPSPEAIESAWRRVQLARHPERPRTLDLVALIFDDFEEPRGDGERAPEGEGHRFEHLPQLRLAVPRGLPQGAAPDAPGRQAGDAGDHLPGHRGGISRT